MKHSWVLGCALIAGFFVAGCGGPGPAPSYTEEEQYALLIKRKVADLSEGLQRNPKDALEAAEAMTEDLGQYTTKGAAAHKATFAELQKTHQELVAALKRSAPKAELKSKVQKIETLARKIPPGAS